MCNVYGSQNEFVERVTREFILRMRSLGQNGPLRRITVSAVATIAIPDAIKNSQHQTMYTTLTSNTATCLL